MVSTDATPPSQDGILRRRQSMAYTTKSGDFKKAAESNIELVSKANREKIVETFDKLLKRSK